MHIPGDPLRRLHSPSWKLEAAVAEALTTPHRQPAEASEIKLFDGDAQRKQSLEEHGHTAPCSLNKIRVLSGVCISE